MFEKRCGYQAYRVLGLWKTSKSFSRCTWTTLTTAFCILSRESSLVILTWFLPGKSWKSWLTGRLSDSCGHTNVNIKMIWHLQEVNRCNKQPTSAPETMKISSPLSDCQHFFCAFSPEGHSYKLNNNLDIWKNICRTSLSRHSVWEGSGTQSLHRPGSAWGGATDRALMTRLLMA